MPIIDAHVHPDRHHDDRPGPFRELDYIINYAESLGVSHMLALGDVLRHGPRPSEEHTRQINDTNWECLETHPDKLIGLCFIQSMHSRQFIREEIRRCVENGPFVGIKCEYPNAASEHLDKLMPIAEELGLVVLQHAWDISRRPMQRELQSDAADVAVLARRYPNAKILMAHLTGCGMRGIREVADCPNIWVDTSGSQPFNSIIEDAISYLGEDRILFGSDCPMRDMAPQLGRILDARISDAQKEKLLYSNAVKLFQLDTPN